MSIAEIERFAADLKSNAALRAEAEKAQADKSHETPLAGAVAFAASKGYAFTADHAKEHIKAKPRLLARNSPMPNSTVSRGGLSLGVPLQDEL